jgi:hypothetical protein
VSLPLTPSFFQPVLDLLNVDFPAAKITRLSVSDGLRDDWQRLKECAFPGLQPDGTTAQRMTTVRELKNLGAMYRVFDHSELAAKLDGAATELENRFGLAPVAYP